MGGFVPISHQSLN